jgi:Predicted protein-tyrosine phosphatase
VNSFVGGFSLLDMENIREVCDSLYVSGHEGVESHGDNFDTVVSMACPCEHTTHDFVISDGEHDYEKFEKAVDSVVSSLRSDNTVLVNCQAGISRSVSVCIAAQVCHYDISFVQSLQNARFGHRLPNPNLMKSAERYIQENYNYAKKSKIRSEVQDEVVETFRDLESSLEDDDYFNQNDRLRLHLKEVIKDRFGEE